MRNVKYALLLVALYSSLRAEEVVAPYDSQKPLAGQPLVAAEQTPGMFDLPEGFQVSLFAGEPAIRQPIAMTFDARGRLWVAQNDTYAEAKINYDKKLSDHIIILADTNNDGVHDQRTVFWDQGKCLTSIEIGFGGVYALCPPQLLFIPDANRDDKPDSTPVVLLDGFDNGPVRHNIANGLKWGPDGWLYGRHGILATSKVGLPGTSEEKRIKLNCAIWRFHPITKVFEVVADGATNSWGMDWDQHGEPFFINTVIGHLWHLIPGAHYRRMFGQDLDPYIYAPIEQHADHVHWASGEKWNDTKPNKGTDATSTAGGGHAHSGLMIYQGDNWPKEYHNKLFTLNFHGRRVNCERLEREGSGYVGRHEPDLIFSRDKWFRGVDLAHGPDGGVYLLDWSDIGECHDHDGVHRHSGRVFKVTYGKSPALPAFDLFRENAATLAAYQTHQNVWWARQARQLLQQRHAAGDDMSAAIAPLKQLFYSDHAVHRLRAAWALFAIGALSEDLVVYMLEHTDEHMRSWAIRLVMDQFPIRGRSSAPEKSVTTISHEIQMLQLRGTICEHSAKLRLVYASHLQRLILTERVQWAPWLVTVMNHANDHNLPLMLWAGIKDFAFDYAPQLTDMVLASHIPLLRQFTARRFAHDLTKNPEKVNLLLERSVALPLDKRRDIVMGLSEGLKGRHKVAAPLAWASFADSLRDTSDVALNERVRELNALFGDGRALQESKQLALNKAADIAQRRSALLTLIENKPDDLRGICEQLLDDRDVNEVAVKGLALYDDVTIAQTLVKKYRKVFRPEAKSEVINVLVSRPAFATVLLNSLGDSGEMITKADITAFQARQIRGFNDQTLTALLSEKWGALRDSSEDKAKTIAWWKATLTPAVIAQANLSQGRLCYMQVCSACHKLYGQGGFIGPDLTGAGRSELSFLLENIIDPSAVVGADFLMSVVTLKDGRAISGVVGNRSGETVTIQTMTGPLTVASDAIQSVQTSTASMMPEGLLQMLNPDQVRDLIGYLMHPQQVPLP
jgi:putative membrane-bound dehydrogenase-like protein